jgi:hypothetical protein
VSIVPAPKANHAVVEVSLVKGAQFKSVSVPDPNRLFYDPATHLIYFGYGGQNAGFDAYERVGVPQATRGCALRSIHR